MNIITRQIKSHRKAIAFVLFKGVNVLSVMSLVFYTSLFGILVAPTSSQAAPESSGKIWTTTSSCGEDPQDENHYQVGDHVFINGDHFDHETYSWNIKGQPGSTDPNIIVASGSHHVGSDHHFCFDAYTVQSGDQGEYKVTFGGKHDNYQVDAPAVGSLKLTKVVDSGSASADAFSFTLSPDPNAVGPINTSGGTHIFSNLTPGTYSVLEGAMTDYSVDPATSTCTDVSVVAGQQATCEIHNIHDTGSVTVNKEFDDNGDGTVDRTNPEGWAWDITDGSQDNVGGSTQTVLTGSTTVIEEAISNYHATWTCNNDASGSGVSITQSISKDEALACTFRNTRDTGHVTFQKLVDTGNPNDWTFTVHQGEDAWGPFANGQSVDLPTGSYTVTENGPDGYNFGFASGICTEDGKIYMNVDEQGGTCTFSNTHIPTPPSLTITKTDNDDTANPGDVQHYVISVVNSGETTAHGVQVVDTLPAQVVSVANISPAATSQTATTITWSGLTIPHGTTTLSYDATLQGSFPVGTTTVTNTADLSCNPLTNLDSIQLNVIGSCTPQQATDPTTVTINPQIQTNRVPAGPTITLVKTDSPDVVAAGANITYTLTYKVADASVTGLTLVDPLPVNTTFVSASDSGVYDSATKTVTWMLGDKGVGSGSVTLVLKTNAPIPNNTIITNIATLDSKETAPVSASQTTTVTSAPALSISKTATPAVTAPGTVVSYSVTVKNNGTDEAKNAVLSDVLPAGFTTLDKGEAAFSAKLGTLSAGSSSTITYQVVVDANQAAGKYINTATVTADNHAAISAIAEVSVRIPEVLGSTSPTTQVPQVLGAEDLPATGTGLTDYIIALIAFVVLALGIRLSLPKAERVRSNDK